MAEYSVTKPKESIADKVAKYLKDQPPLTLIDRRKLLAKIHATSPSEKVSATSALDYYTANTGVSKRGKGRSRPKYFYAIRISLPYEQTMPPAPVYLSIPGVPRELLNPQVAETQVEDIISHLQTEYGKETVDYWCRSAQRRSVDFVKPAKIPCEACQLCKVADELCQQKVVTSRWRTKRKITACHIVARKTVFWTTLAEIFSDKINIFSEEGTTAIRRRLKENPWHSDPSYILTLCKEHDDLLNQVLKTAAT